MNDKLESHNFDLSKIVACKLVAQLEFAPRMDSTNNRAKLLLSENPTFPLLVITDRQTAGRGRGSKRWLADHGSLTLTYAIPDPLNERLHLLPLLAGLAVARTIEQTEDCRCNIKWPNDVFLNDKKIGGILVESVVCNDDSRACLIGIGINLFTKVDPNLLPGASSIATELNHRENRTTVGLHTTYLLNTVSEFWKLLDEARSDILKVIQEINQKSWLVDKSVMVRIGGEKVEGQVGQILPDGQLELITRTGVVPISSGEVTLV